MNSKLFDLGFDPIYLMIIIGVFAIAAFVIGILCLMKVTRVWVRYDRFMRGHDAETLEELLHQILADNELLTERQNAIIASIEKLTREHDFSLRKHALLKYNAFKEAGGKLSFSLAMLTANNDGFILTCMTSNGPSYTYLKEIINGESYVGLSTEETQVLEEAMKFEIIDL